MKATKSIISVIIAVILAVSAVLPAFAENQCLEMSVSSEKVNVGDTVVVTVVYDGFGGITSGKIPIRYDPNVFSYVEGSAEFVGDGMFVAEVQSAGKLNIAFAYNESSGEESIVYTAKFAAVSEGACEFRFDVTAYIVNDRDTDDITKNGCKVIVSDNAIQTDWWMAADLNGDGKISLGKDLNYFWEAYWHNQSEEFGFEIDCDIDDLCARADFNGDGKINLGIDLNYFWSCYWAYQDAV